MSDLETRNVLATCPPDKRDRWRSIAIRAENGPRQRQAAIRIKCLECCCWQEAQVRRCELIDCALWGLGGQDALKDPGDERLQEHEHCA